jgi:hypothetical protein
MLNPTNKPVQLDVFNSMGEKIHSETINGAFMEINSSGWSGGVYIFRIITGNNSVSKKVIKY